MSMQRSCYFAEQEKSGKETGKYPAGTDGTSCTLQKGVCRIDGVIRREIFRIDDGWIDGGEMPMDWQEQINEAGRKAL